MTWTNHSLLVPWPRKSRAILLLPLRTVQPVHSLSACTSVHFTFTYTSTPPMDRTVCTEPQWLYKGALYLYLYLYSPYGPYGLYRASVPVQRCTLPLPIPLLPLWTVQPVQNLSACTTVHFTFTFRPVKYSSPKHIGQKYSRVLCVCDNTVICFAILCLFFFLCFPICFPII